MVGEIREEILSSIERNTLLNAIRHNGKASANAVISKVIGEFPELRNELAHVRSIVLETVNRINSLSIEEQRRIIEEKYPTIMQQRKAEAGRTGLPELPGAENGVVTLRLPPEPSGYMHIGHAMSFIINYAYKQIYNGKLWLRFEDTNPRKAEKRYYDSFRNGIRWLDIKWDYERNVSEDLEIIYPYCRRLIELGYAYACSCDEAKVKKLRFEGKICEHREQSVEKNLEIFEAMLSRKYNEGDYVIRLKGDMKSLDYSLRDPNIFRIVYHEHPITGTRYCLWPTYDFANVVEDEICKVTHVLRSSEFHLQLQNYIRRLLSFRDIKIVQYSRFKFKGTPVQKRLLRPLVEKGLVSGWDDPRMPTIEGIRRRGIIAEAIKQFTINVGYTNVEHEYDWSLLFAINRKLVDNSAKRIFFVPQPVRLFVEGAEEMSVAIKLHPEFNLGTRTITVSNEFYIPASDIRSIEVGEVFRLMELYNVKLLSKGDNYARAEFFSKELIHDMKKVQWVTNDNIPIKVLEPGVLFRDDGTFNYDSLREVRGYVEPYFRNLGIGEIVQFPRYGFCRIDSSDTCILAHR